MVEHRPVAELQRRVLHTNRFFTSAFNDSVGGELSRVFGAIGWRYAGPTGAEHAHSDRLVSPGTTPPRFPLGKGHGS